MGPSRAESTGLWRPFYGEFSVGIVLPELGESQLQSPDFVLVLKTVRTDESQPKQTRQVSRGLGRIRGWAVGGSTTTYSLISFSFSKGLLGVLEVFLSEKKRVRQIVV